MTEIGNRRAHRATVLIALLLASPSLAQDNDAPPDRPGIPVVGRPTTHFYNAAGTGIKLHLGALPTELATNEWLKCTLTITGLLNAPDVEKPSLKSLPDFATFQVDEAKQLDPPPEEQDRRIFVYRLRPSSTAVSLVPEIAFYYFDPKRLVLPNRPQDRFPRAVSNAVPIRVHAPPAPPPAAPAPLRVPPFCEQLASARQVLRESPGPQANPLSETLLIFMGAPLLALLYVLVWRSRNPDAAKQRRLQRRRAVRVALAEIDRARGREPSEFAERVDRALLRYLHERFELPAHAATPSDVGAFLRSFRASRQAVELFEACLTQCDAIRFGASDVPDDALLVTARQAILALEEGG